MSTNTFTRGERTFTLHGDNCVSCDRECDKKPFYTNNSFDTDLVPGNLFTCCSVYPQIKRVGWENRDEAHARRVCLNKETRTQKAIDELLKPKE